MKERELLKLRTSPNEYRLLGYVRARIVPALLVMLALLLAACGSPAGTTPGAGATQPATAKTPTPTSQPADVITEFPAGGPSGITAGPDGNLWFTECVTNASGNCGGAGKIGRITPGGQITEFPLPVADSSPSDITAGPDGNLWFTECTSTPGDAFCPDAKIGRITPGGQFTEFTVPTRLSAPSVIAAGPDGNLWFTEGTANQIGRVTPSGQITEFRLPQIAGKAIGITGGPDGNVWFTYNDQIGRITPGGQITLFPLPTPRMTFAITAGPDGNLWFTEYHFAQIGRITPAGQITEFPASGGSAITAGPDGNLWYTEDTDNRIGRITPAGQFTDFPLPAPRSFPVGITAGPDKNLWFTELVGNKIGRITP